MYLMKGFTLNITNDLALLYPELSMAQELFDLINSDREHIGKFLPFVDITKSVDDETNYLKMKLSGVANGTDFPCFITKSDRIIGTIDLHFINHDNKKAEIGYWLHSSYARQGLTKLAVQTICDYAFQNLGLNKLVIKADTENIASNQVAQSCGFRLVGVKKQDMLMRGEFRDMNVYEILKSEWEKKL